MQEIWQIIKHMTIVSVNHKVYHRDSQKIDHPEAVIN
jgi:hypothetical protein